ncbi:PREDICTED: taste receptor type 2 member 3-like [Condylura cristata]|uniref:taste receptor type 2 member 3-like n=1 Tax=Condylura cristata TaxID=143302 RepID=UPI00033454B0|nr:PREDICTED: taste receptor type 2 member 3-like [Condylura cristata]
MSGLPECVFLLLSTTQFILGVLGNSFIVCVHGRSWLQSRRISLSDFIVTTLALSRLILLFSLLADGVLMVFPSQVCDRGVEMHFLEIIWTFTNDLSIWLVTCLNALYCLRIASFSHPTFLWLKWRVSRLVAWMLLGALLLSCASTMSLIHEFKICSVLIGIDATRNMTEHFRKKHEYELVHGLGILWNVPPLVVSLTSCLVLLLSLGRHTREMRQHGGSAGDPSTEAHQRAIRAILSFLLLFLLYFLALLLISSSHFLPGTEMIRMTGVLIKMFYPTGHSFILIRGHNKLKQMFAEMRSCEPCRLRCGTKAAFSP